MKEELTGTRFGKKFGLKKVKIVYKSQNIRAQIWQLLLHSAKKDLKFISLLRKR